MSENEQIAEERAFWRSAVQLISPDHRIYGWDYKQAATINTPSGQYELLGFIAQRLIDLSDRAEAAERKLARARDQFEALGSVVPCERYEDDVLLNGLCLISDMVAPANPKYPMLEAYEAVAVWLKDYAQDALAQIEQPPTVIDIPADHALSELYKDPQFLKEYREGLTEERARLGIEQPHGEDSKLLDAFANLAWKFPSHTPLLRLFKTEDPKNSYFYAMDRDEDYKCTIRQAMRNVLDLDEQPQSPKQQLPGEDSDGEPCQCSACAALRARAEVERTP